jgi:hypothetical protein
MNAYQINNEQLNEILSRLPNIYFISNRFGSIQLITTQRAKMKYLTNSCFTRSTGNSYFDCVQLKSLSLYCDGKKIIKEEMGKFVQQQHKLTSLDVDFMSQAKAKFQLNEFKIYQAQPPYVVDLVQLRDFLETQKALRILRFETDKKSLCETDKSVQLMSTICLRLEKLESLEISLRDSKLLQDDPKVDKLILELAKLKIHNKTVKKLTIRFVVENFGIVGQIINLFDSLKVVDFVLFGRDLKINGESSTMKLESFGLINVKAANLQSFEFSTESPPEDRKIFEENIGKFLTQNGKNIRKVLVGHVK